MLAIPTTLTVDALDSTLGRDPILGLGNGAPIPLRVECIPHLSRILFNRLFSRRDFQDVVAQDIHNYDG